MENILALSRLMKSIFQCFLAGNFVAVVKTLYYKSCCDNVFEKSQNSVEIRNYLDRKKVLDPANIFLLLLQVKRSSSYNNVIRR